MAADSRLHKARAGVAAALSQEFGMEVCNFVCGSEPRIRRRLCSANKKPSNFALCSTRSTVAIRSSIKGAAEFHFLFQFFFPVTALFCFSWPLRENSTTEFLSNSCRSKLRRPSQLLKQDRFSSLHVQERRRALPWGIPQISKPGPFVKRQSLLEALL